MNMPRGQHHPTTSLSLCPLSPKHHISLSPFSPSRSKSAHRPAGARHRLDPRPGHFLLTYAVVSAPPYQPLPEHLPRRAVRAAFRRPFTRWARVIPVRFRKTRDYNTAHVRVGFLAGDHGDGEPFDGPLGMLGHAFSPPSGQLHLDAAERWAVLGHDNDDPGEGAVDLESVATHEIGHVLRLAHSSVPVAVMYPSLKPRTRKADLTLDDVRGMQALYDHGHREVMP